MGRCPVRPSELDCSVAKSEKSGQIWRIVHSFRLHQQVSRRVLCCIVRFALLRSKTISSAMTFLTMSFVLVNPMMKSTKLHPDCGFHEEEDAENDSRFSSARFLVSSYVACCEIGVVVPDGPGSSSCVSCKIFLLCSRSCHDAMHRFCASRSRRSCACRAKTNLASAFLHAMTSLNTVVQVESLAPHDYERYCTLVILSFL